MARRAGVAYNWGWRLSRAATLDKVDADRLARELDVRGVTCEMPGCDFTAFSVLSSGVTALVCFTHTTAYQTSAKLAAAIEAAIKYGWQSQMAITTNAAYEDSEDSVVVTFTRDQGLLAKARLATQSAELLMAAEAKRLAAVAAAPDSTSEDEDTRPTLNNLYASNTTEDLFDPFIL